MKHTPLPWSHSEQKGTPGHCFVAQVWGPNGTSLAEINPTDDPKEGTANAEYIVLAANAYPELVAALQMVLKRWTFNNYQQHTHSWHDMQDCAEVIRAALSKGATK